MTGPRTDRSKLSAYACSGQSCCTLYRILLTILAQLTGNKDPSNFSMLSKYCLRPRDGLWARRRTD